MVTSWTLYCIRLGFTAFVTFHISSSAGYIFHKLHIQLVTAGRLLVHLLSTHPPCICAPPCPEPSITQLTLNSTGLLLDWCRPLHSTFMICFITLSLETPNAYMTYYILFWLVRQLYSLATTNLHLSLS